ncbi:MAG: DNA-protecting protein DprA, partial [Cytophagales bacterium]|nr:DNA-protecting protein DprA [Cytophagales bacterium]
AHIFTSPSDIIELLNWDLETKQTSHTSDDKLEDLSDEEKLIYNLLSSHGETHMDDVSFQTLIPINKTASIILGLEFKGIVKALPGKKFKLS